MQFQLRHRLHYRYAAPAMLDFQVLRLRPREDGNQRLLTHQLSISPEPSLVSQGLDEHGNVESRAWFLGETVELKMEAQSLVETTRVNPFDFIIERDWMVLPWEERLVKVKPALAPCLPQVKDSSLVGLAEGIRHDGGSEILPFLLRLNKWLYERLVKETRREGPPRSPAETLLLGRGACRDLTAVFMALARTQGIPARFVTGYYEGTEPNTRKELHAWAEVFLPGAGWRGFDPTVGLAVADRHVALSAAPESQATAVVSGVFTAANKGSELETEVLFLDQPA